MEFLNLENHKIDIKNRMEKIGVPLKEWDIKINYGIKTGLNEAFIIDSAKKDELIKRDPKSSELIKPILYRRDIKKYEINFTNNWIITTFPSLNINIDDYSAIKEYLQTFGKRLEQSGEKGCRKKTSNEWFETQDEIAYYKEFEKEKIFFNEIYPDRKNRLNFALDVDGYYCTNKLYFITSNDINIRYLLAILNSSLLKFYFETIFDFKKWRGSFENIHIPKIPKSIERYKQNIDYLLTLPKKKIYDKETKYAIGECNGREIYTTEFLMAKQFGCIEKFQGHNELKEYIKLLPFIFSYTLFDTLYFDTKSKRNVYILDDGDNRKIAHVVDENNYLLSVYLLRKREFKRFLKRAEVIKEYLSGEAPISPILSPARATFWRHLDLIEALYQDLEKSTITQEEFVTLVDEILEAKKQIALYKKDFDSLNAKEKIEIKEEIEKLEKKIEVDIEKIDCLTFKLYQLNDKEIKLIEETTK